MTTLLQVAAMAELASFVVLVMVLVQVRRLRSELNTQTVASQPARGQSRLVLNLSGHPMSVEQSEEGWLAECRIVTAPSHNADLSRPGEAARSLVQRFDPDTLEVLRHGLPVVVALPGATALAAHLLVAVHAVSGRFPLFTWAVPTSEGYRWVRPVDLQAFRAEVRSLRGTGGASAE